MPINDITEAVLKFAFKVHTELGPGLLESTYKECLFYELSRNGFKVEKEKALPIIYDDIQLNVGYRIDLLVEDSVIVELKTVENFSENHIAQVLTYLKHSGCRVGLLLNFNCKSLKNGIKRLVL